MANKYDCLKALKAEKTAKSVLMDVTDSTIC